ncbi:FGGY-family carbohydrate kinase [uncultured Clostridium sp.]|uniref:FGGY-family carbohydrate kinase n=1 Tax=uncultured Clostridium sp. TaxID=59620 RepID=UPI0032178C7F
MEDKYVLSIDCGTQSVRALIFNGLGTLVAKEKLDFQPYFSNKPGWAEQDPEIWWQGVCHVCTALKENNSTFFNEILAVAVTTQRDTGINVDKNGEALRPAIIWLDQRMAECKKPISKRYDFLFRLIGMKKAIEVSRKKCKANWIMENQPEIWRNTYKYLLLSGYLNFKLTGNFVDSIASQIGHIPFNFKKKDWPKGNKDYRWEISGVEREKLPQLVEVGERIGEISPEVAKVTGLKIGIPVIAAGSDKGCETLGTGCKNEKWVNLSFGTTATVQTMSKKYIEPLMFMPAYPACIPGYYNPEFEIFRGYWMISWFKREFARKEAMEAEERDISYEEILNERLKDVPPGCHGLMLQPYWGPGLKYPEAKGAIIGFGDVHTRSHIYRAIIEGINYGLLDGIEKIERKTKEKVKYVMVSGGGSQSDTICQITASMLNRKVYKTTTHETSGLGAAIITFVALGMYVTYNEAIEKMVHYKKIFTPEKEYTEIYSKLFKKVYKRIYRRLKSLYSDIGKITNYPDI